MIKLRRHCLAIGLLALNARSVAALELNDLSPEARKLLPDKSAVTVVLRDGTTVEGRLVAQTDQEVSVRVTEGTISSLKKLSRAQVKEITPLDVATGLAKALTRFRLDPKVSYPAAEYEKALALFDEFLAKCADHPQRDEIAKVRAAFAGELDLVRQGCEKINGQWETPIRGAILKFDLCTARMAELRKEHPGVERADFRGQAQARAAYLELEQKQRDIARDLPKIMRDRMPVLLEAGKFDEAVAEVNAFLRFWILRVLRSEAAAADRVRLGQDLFAGMDFNYILRLEKQILSTYTNAGHGGVPTGVTVAADAVYIPGGYFLMGREDADPASDDFPLRLVNVKPFLMDRYEVSNRQYREFVEYVRRTGDSSMEHPLAPPLKDHTPVGWKYPALSRDDQPVVGVDWFDAYAYAKWAGKRLPTEAEWEKAARGLDARLYPWGNDESGKRLVNCPTGRRAVAAEIDRRKPPPPQKRSWLSCVRRKPPEPPPPTVLPDETWDVNQTLPPQALTNVWGTLDYEPPESPYGVVHLAGNAAEWVADWYDPTYYVTGAVENPLGPESGQVHVFRGGSYLDDGPELLSTRRGFPKNDQMKKGCAPDGRPMVGIRCVRDLPVTP